jgi:hypothetical protein
MKHLQLIEIRSANSHAEQAQIDANWKGRCIDRLRHIDPTMFELEAQTLAEILWQSPTRRMCPPEEAAAGAFVHP